MYQNRGKRTKSITLIETPKKVLLFMLDDFIVSMIVSTWRICKWFFLQILLMYLMPYLWNNHFNGENICLILFYTTLYAIYWEAVPKDKKWNWLSLPYFVYSCIAILLCSLLKTWNVSVWYSFLLPIYGAMCVILIKICRKQFRDRKSVV